MKKLTALILALVMALSFASCAKKEEPADEPQIVGGWHTPENGEITEELKVLFEKAIGEMTGASYEPIELIGTQVVAGKNYKFLAKQTLVTNPPVEKKVYVTIYEDLEGNLSVTNIEEIEGQSEDTKGISAIPLGGNLGDLDLSGAGLEYTEIEMPENLTYEGCESHLYYCETSDFRYFSTYRWAKNGSTLQEEAERQQQEYGWTNPQYALWDELDFGVDIGVTETASLYGGDYYFDNGEYYFSEYILFEDGDDFVEICFDSVSEELQLGDTGEYIWVPAGYTDLNTEEFITEYGSIMYGEYPAEYYYPTIGVTHITDSYKFASWLWSEKYPDGLPITKEQYDKWKENGWNDETSKKYAEAFGFTDYVVGSFENELGNNVTYLAGNVGDYDVSLTYVEVNGEMFNICTTTLLKPSPKYAKAISESIHTK